LGLRDELGVTSGGKEYEVGLVSPTPEMLSFMTGVVTGGLGREIDKAVSFAEGKIKGESMPAYKIPIASRFYGEAGGDAATRGKYYDAIKEINAADFAKRRLEKDDKDPSEYQNLADLASKLRKTQARIGDMRKDLQSETDAAVRKQIEADILIEQRDLIEAFEQAAAGAE